MPAILLLAFLAAPADLSMARETSLPLPLVQDPPDTLEGIQRARQLIRNHYGTRIMVTPRGGFPRGSGNSSLCDGGRGDFCHGGDPDRGSCPIDVPCHRTEEFLVDGLYEEALAYPTSGFLTGQAVYALLKFGYPADAAAVAEACEAEGWWCSALEGYVFYAQGRWVEAEARFREALASAPPSLRCTWGDATWLLGTWDQRTAGVESLPESRQATAEWSCERRMSFSDTLFWWGDPLFSDESNDRWTEHVARALGLHLYGQIQEVRRGGEVPQRYRDFDWAMRIRRGVWDSYEARPGREARFWTSLEAAAFRFLPRVELDDISNPVWTLEGDVLHEGFTPDSGPFLPLPVQIARFREGDRLRIATAGAMDETPLRRVTEAEVFLNLSDGPGSSPVKTGRTVRREVPRFLESAPAREYTLALEALTENGIGWHRSLLSPLSPDGPELSDLLLYDSSGGGEAPDLSRAAEAMLGSTSLPQGGDVGVFWELYEVPSGETLELSLTLERDPGGLVDRLIGLFPGGSREGRGRVAWTEPASGPLHPRGIVLSLSTLEPGEYTLVLQARWPGQETLERRRRLTIGEEPAPSE